MSETIKTAAEDLRRKLVERVTAIKDDPRMGEVFKLAKGLNSLEEILGDPPTSLGELFGIGAGGGGGVSRPTLDPDEFHLTSPLEAAKAYLRKVGKPPRPFQEIVDAILSHGGKIENQDQLRIQLARSTYQVSKVPPDSWGLVEWYGDRKSKTPRRKGMKSATGEAAATPSDLPEMTKDEEEAETEAASEGAGR